ncbi:hypothetical protein KJ657_03435 [Patescibacteria group bacterium]|nr:hypothetical protein [Patescibacteria group bacterium]MBU1016117.1 hypothetical protein [Patescibacteria group bacterium]MBU1684860.1 hypothetical protein [Patescibacteria group bacterium]MBU1938576.1 hypothetical protein [Patescibacteria group bacterium]
MPHKKTPILPDIKLKYSERRRTPAFTGITCAACRRKNVKIGSAIDAYTANPKFVCEECTIFHYQIDNGISSLKAAASRRRRIFDVPYLFNEMFTDRYMAQFGHSSLDDLEDSNLSDILEASGDLYNYLYTKEDKMRLEKIEDQKEIEWEFSQVLSNLDLSRIFPHKKVR